MPDEFVCDLLSACLDDEATAAQRADVEARLAGSEETRRFLAELSELSRELQSLPIPDCPSDFAARVMRTIEAGRLQPPASGARRTRLLRNAAVLAATAAALCLALNVLNPRPEAPLPRVASSSDQESGKTREVVVAATDSRAGKRNAEFKKGADSLADGGNARPTQRFVPGGGDQAPPKASGGRIPNDPLVPPILLGSSQSGTGHSSQRLVFIDDLQKLSGDDVGRVLTAIEHSPRGISIVKLTVIDCRHGLDALQVLLSRNRIHLQPSLNEPAADAKADSSKGRPPQRLVAVYVQSSSERLASVMSELKSNVQFRRLQVDPPISPTRLEPKTQHQIAMLDPLRKDGLLESPGGQRGRRSASGGRPQYAKKSTAPTAGAHRDAVGKKVANEEHGRDKPATGKAADPRAIAELDRISKQLHVTIPAGLLDREPQRAVANRNAAGRKPSQVAASGNSGRQPAGPLPSAVRPLRVLFVLVCPPAVKSPATLRGRKRGS